jgi:hypothetical protein
MDLTPPLAPSDSRSMPVGLGPPVETYLTRLADHQSQFLAAWTDTNRSLHPSSGQVAKLAAIQLRMSQEFLDAQRAIVRRRAETEATIVAIAAEAEAECTTMIDQARSQAAIVVGASEPPVMSANTLAPRRSSDGGRATTPGRLAPPNPAGRATELAAPQVVDESLAMLIDNLFESSEPDGVAARRELRSLLDGWWGVEKQESQAAIDDAHARAAMRRHLARVEADELARFAPPCVSVPAVPIHTPHPPSALPIPIEVALDSADHEHLDDVLAHLLDSLGPVTAATPPEQLTASEDSGAVITLPDPVGGPSDPLNDRTAAPQEAFDRFWGTFTAGGSRTWLLPQLMLPAVTVIAVLALVLAVVG